MFNIGFGELAIICIVLIIAVGPERLPSMMKSLGKTLRTLRQASRDIRASTGIDELMREDFDLYSPPAPRRPLVAQLPPTPPPLGTPEQSSSATAATAPTVASAAPGDTPISPPAAPLALPAESSVAAEPKPISREDLVEAPSVVAISPPASAFIQAPSVHTTEAAPGTAPVPAPVDHGDNGDGKPRGE
jgi:sec-independent protein translocase protein TatB